jgi:predicted PurR-regulated permease PerM
VIASRAFALWSAPRHAIFHPVPVPEGVMPPGSSWRRPAFYAVTGLVIGAVIVFAHEVMLPFVLALVIAYVLTPLVGWVEKQHVRRVAAILLVYVVVLGSLGLFVRLTAPRIAQELAGLRRDVPDLVSEVRDHWIPKAEERLRAVGLSSPPAADDRPARAPGFVAHLAPDGSLAIDVGSGVRVVQTHSGYLVRSSDEKDEPRDAIADAFDESFSYVQRNAIEFARIGRDIVLGVARAVFVFGLTLMLAAYMMITREKIYAFFISLVTPRRRDSFGVLLARVDRGLSGVVRGQLLICLINGALCAVGFAILGLKYWPVLAIVATVCSLIPIFGSIAGAIPAVLLGLTQSFGTAMVVVLFIVGVHQLEANVLNPKIMGDWAKIHPVLVIFSLLVGEHFFQAAGALLAVPTMSIAQSLFLHFREVIERGDPQFTAARVPESTAFADAAPPR